MNAFYRATIAVLMVIPAAHVLAQVPAPPQVIEPGQIPLSAPASQVPQFPPTIPQSSRELEQKVEVLQTQITTLSNVVTYGGIVLGVFLALGAAGSIFSLWNFERRTRESHSLAIRGESAAQGRASEVHQTFLEGSKTTLDLVNSTLTLAKDASERAAHFLEEKARESLGKLDREAQELLSRIDRSNDRALVASQAKRSELTSLAQKLAAFEINKLILPRDVKLTPPCLFIRGMEHHLKQQFEDALTYWKEVALEKDTDEFLRSLAWYWIGYEYNNMGRFSDAVGSFEQAYTFSVGARSFELQRIILESRFFNKKDVNPESLVSEFDGLLNRIQKEEASNELETRRRKICGTLGNVLHILGENSRRSGDEETAKVNYQRAAHMFAETAESDQWARFGLAEAIFRGGRVADAQKMFKETIYPEAQAEGVNRVEPRTKVLNRQTELICCIRLPEFAERIVFMKSQVLESLSEVDERLTVYSQLQRRNVLRDDFRKDLDALISESTAADGLSTRPQT